MSKIKIGWGEETLVPEGKKLIWQDSFSKEFPSMWNPKLLLLQWRLSQTMIR